MEETRPYVSAPQASIKPIVSCHYWNGDICDFEVTTDRQCRFHEGHIQGVNTFVKPFVAKQLEMEQSERDQFLEWKRMKDLSSKKRDSLGCEVNNLVPAVNNSEVNGMIKYTRMP
jgi:hypothetical protein